MTPYTSLASSSNERPVLVIGLSVAEIGVWRSGDGCSISLTATTTPELDESVFRGLARLSPPRAETAWLTAGRRPPSTAGFGRRVRCQSW